MDDEGNSELISQDTTSDFCFHCVVDVGITKSKVRRFYKSIFEDQAERNAKLAVWERRF